MNSSTSLFRVLKVFVVALVSSATLAIAATEPVYRLDEAAGVLTVIGQGQPPSGVQNPAQSRLMAERAAIVEAYGAAVRVLSDSMSPMRLEQQGYSGFLRGGRIARSEQMPDGSVKVELEIPLSREFAARFREVMQQRETVASEIPETAGLGHADFVARHRIAGPRPITTSEWLERYQSGAWPGRER